MEVQTPEEQISSRQLDKLDYCQQCHLHKSECRCEDAIQMQPADSLAAQKQSRDIMLSTWTISIKGVQKTVEGIVVVDKGKANIAKDETFRRRVKRELRLSSDEFDVLDITFTMKLGETFAV